MSLVLTLTFKGRANYNRSSATSMSTRPILAVFIGGQSAEAYLDTGMPVTVCPPDFAATLLSLDPADGLEEEVRIRGVLVKGRMHNASIEFVADQGTVTPMNAVVFVPDSAADVGPDLAGFSFLGMYECLNKLIFGVDALTEVFYFN
jgi:hypothetical protein